MSTAFTDRKGREWDISLDLRKARLIDHSDFKEYWDKPFSILNLNLELIQKLLTDGPFLFAIIWSMVQEQAEAKWQVYQASRTERERAPRETTLQGYQVAVVRSPPFNPPTDTFPLSPEEAEAAELEFVSGINGPVIEAGRSAFMEALGDFFPDQRTALSTLNSQLKKLTIKMEKKLNEEAVPLMDQLLDEELDKRVAEMKSRLKILAQSTGETSSVSPPPPMSASLSSGNPAIPSSISP